MSEMSINEICLWRKLTIIQWILTLGIVSVAILWRLTVPEEVAQQHHGFIAILLCAAVLLVLPLFEAKVSQPWRLCLLLAQVAILFVCSTFASPFILSVNFVVLAARASILLSGKKLIVAIATMLFAVVGAPELRVALNLPLPKNDGPPLIKTVGRIEAELAVLVAICVVGFLSRKMIQEQRARTAAETLTREMQDMAVELERNRIAQDIHDNLGHILTSLCIQLELTKELQQDKKLDQSEQALNTAIELATDSFDEVRRAVRAIRDDLDLKEATTRLAQRIADQQKIKVDVDVDLDASKLPMALRHELFCIAQECLTNVQKHSQATEVRLCLKQQDGRIELKVEDNGIGYRGDSHAHGFGIVGMRDRVKVLGGSLKIEPAKTRGTVVQVIVPT